MDAKNEKIKDLKGALKNIGAWLNIRHCWDAKDHKLIAKDIQTYIRMVLKRVNAK